MSDKYVPLKKLATGVTTETLHGPVPTNTVMALATGVLALLEELEHGAQSSIDRKFRIMGIAHGSGKIYDESNSVLFLCKDEAFLETLPDYRRNCERLGAGHHQLMAVDLLIERVKRFQEENETKIPDVDPITEASTLEP